MGWEWVGWVWLIYVEWGGLDLWVGGGRCGGEFVLGVSVSRYVCGR